MLALGLSFYAACAGSNAEENNTNGGYTHLTTNNTVLDLVNHPAFKILVNVCSHGTITPLIIRPGSIMPVPLCRIMVMYVPA
jgi:hypothetical protein